jgi:lysozyme
MTDDGFPLLKTLISEFEGRIESELVFDEGFRGDVYPDSRGIKTIGFGHNVEASPLPIGLQPPLNYLQGIQLLRIDLAKAEQALLIKLPWIAAMAEDARKGVLVDLAFNLGINGLLEFRRLLDAARLGLWEIAEDELRASRYFTQAPKRAARLATQLITNVWAVAIDLA